MQLISYVLVLIIAYLMFKTLYNFKLKKMSFRRFLIWEIFLALAIISILTNFLGYFSQQLGVERGADLVVYLSILLILFFILKIFVQQEEDRKTLTKLIRQIAINEAIERYPARIKTTKQ